MKILFWIGSATIVLGLGCAMVYFMRQAAAEAETSRRLAQAESECVAQIQRMSELVTQKENEKGVRSRVTQSTNHYNQSLHRCYVEITTYEHSDSTVFVKTLLTPADNAAVLWSITGRQDHKERECFGPDAMPLSCEEADRPWNVFMTQ